MKDQIGFEVMRTDQSMLFEKFNSQSLDLLTMLTEAGEGIGLSDGLLKDIKNKLTVTSFNEFLERFSPVIYEITTENGIEFTDDKERAQQGKGRRLDLDDKIIKMLCDLLDSRKSSIEANINFDYSAIIEQLSPSDTVKNAKNSRKQLEYIYGKMSELDEENPLRKDYIKMFRNERKKVAKIYKDNPMNLLPLAMEDARLKLELMEKTETCSNGATSLPKIGYRVFDENGNTKFIPYESKDETIEAKENSENKLIGFIKSDYESVTKDIEEKSFSRNLVVTTFTGGALTTRKNSETSEELKARLKNYQDIYKENVEGMMNSLRDIISKILGVKTFFDQSILANKPSLLITNNSVEELSNKKELFEKFLKVTNKNVNKKNKYWIGILPNIDINNKEETIDDDDDCDIDLNDGFGEESGEGIKTNSTNSLVHTNNILEILNRYNIFTFIGFEACEETSLAGIQKNGISIFKDIINKFGKMKHVIPCYPNFTVLPKGNSTLSIGNKFEIDDEDGETLVKTEEKHLVVLDGIYINSAFVGAGLVASYQNPKILEEKGLKIDKKEYNMPCVRHNLEEGENAYNFVTSIGKESAYGWCQEVSDEINEFNKGMIFSSNYANYKGKEVNNTYVMKLRNLEGIPLFKEFVSSYTNDIYEIVTGRKMSNLNNFENLIKKLKRLEGVKNNLLKFEDNIETIDTTRMSEEIIGIKFEKDDELLSCKVIVED